MNNAVQFTIQSLVSQRQSQGIDKVGDQQKPAVARQLLIQPGEFYHPDAGYTLLQVLEGRAWVTQSGFDLLLVTSEQLELSANDTNLSITPLTNRPVRVVLR